MFCPNCGAQTVKEYAFCANCGYSLVQVHPNNNKHRSGKKVFVIIALAIITVALLFFVFRSLESAYPKNELKYAWGTSLSYIENNEYVTESKYDYLKCEDPKHTVDSLIDFEINNDYVIYYGYDTSKLKGISYSFDDMTFAKRAMIVEEYYGKEYYIMEQFNEKFYAYSIWYKGDTVIVLDYNSIIYYCADYFWEEGPSFFGEGDLEEVKNFFGIK